MQKPDFWDEPNNAKAVMKDINSLQEQVKNYEKLERMYEDTQTLWQLGIEEHDESLEAEVASHLADFERKLKSMELAVLLNERYDRNNAIFSMHAGAGGTEAQDWVEMLLRMYNRWAENNNFKVEVLDYLTGDEAGVKSVTLLVKGEHAYGYLKAEKGVHRLVRISPFDSSGRRHTSFASVDVIPEVADETEIEVSTEELKIDTYRAGGAGGQHVNKTDSAVRITHLPTGTVVQCQNERSQHSNRLAAMKILQAKLWELKRQQEEKEMAVIRGEQQDIAWGSQIRSYIFQPYTMVKDHRTQVEVGNVDAVMDGNIDGFIAAYLQMQVMK